MPQRLLGVSETTIARVVNGVRAELAAVQIDSRQQQDALARLEEQVSLLQRGFVSLASAFSEELSVVSQEAATRRTESEELRSVTKALEARLSEGAVHAELGSQQVARRVQTLHMQAEEADRALAHALLEQHHASLKAQSSLEARLAAAEDALEAQKQAQVDAAAQAKSTGAVTDELSVQLSAMATRQSQHAQQIMSCISLSSEEVSAAVDLASRAESRANVAAAALSAQHDALCRASGVFAAALHIPCPLAQSAELAAVDELLTSCSPRRRRRAIYQAEAPPVPKARALAPAPRLAGMHSLRPCSAAPGCGGLSSAPWRLV